MSDRIHPARAGLAAILLVIGLLVSCGSQREGELIASAKTAIAQRDLPRAVLDLKSVLQQSPSSAEARYLLGLALFELGDPVAALTEFNKAQELGYDESTLLPKRARAMLAARQFKEVVETFAGRELSQPAGQAELRTAVAIAYLSLNRRQEAQASLELALKSDPANAWATVTQARLEAMAGRMDEALALLDGTIRATPGYGEAHLLKGHVLRFVRKDVDGAVAAYKLAAQDHKEAIDARGALMQVHLSRGQLAEAKAEVAALLKSHPKSRATHYLDAIIAYAEKDYARSESITEQLLRGSPTSPSLLVVSGAASLQRGALLSAETKLGKAAQMFERMTVARKLLADTYLRMGQPEKALAALRPLLDAATVDGDALALAGHAHLQAGQVRESEAMFVAASKQKPGDAHIRTALALTDMVKGNADSAFEALQSIAAKDPGDTADLALISAHMRRNDHDAALAAIDRLQKKQPDKPGPHHLRGLALRAKGDLAAARRSFDEALKVEPKHFASVAALARLDMDARKYDEASGRLQAAIKLDPGNAAARLALVQVMRAQKAKHEDLMTVIDEAIKTSPTDAAPRVAKILQLSSTGRVKEAAEAAQQGLATIPQSADLLDAAGRALSNANDDQQALSAFNKLAGLMPQSPTAYLRLADLHAKRGDLAAVASSLGRAFDAAPLAAEVHTRLVSHATRTKDYKLVLASARDLQKRYPDSAAGYLLEGDAEVSRNAWPAAVAAYRQAIKRSDPSGRPQRQLYATLRAAGDIAGASQFAAEWLKGNPKDTVMREILGADAVVRKDYGTAERLFREVVALQPRNAASINNLAWLMAERGDRGAVQMAERALALAPSAPPMLDTLAKALAAAGDIERAIDIQRRLVADVPDRHEYRLNLVRYYVKGGKRSEAGAELDAMSALGDKFPYRQELVELRKSIAN